MSKTLKEEIGEIDDTQFTTSTGYSPTFENVDTSKLRDYVAKETLTLFMQRAREKVIEIDSHDPCADIDSRSAIWLSDLESLYKEATGE